MAKRAVEMLQNMAVTMETGTLQHGAMFLYSNDSLQKTIGEGIINTSYAYVTL